MHARGSFKIENAGCSIVHLAACRWTSCTNEMTSCSMLNQLRGFREALPSHGVRARDRCMVVRQWLRGSAGPEMRRPSQGGYAQ
jgi:hypothetical protein